MAQLEKDPRDVYTRLGVRPIINASGSVTRYGGTRTRPEALEVMADAASVLVEMGELNHRAGEIIAGITGAEAGFVCSGAAGGMVLQAAACIAGGDPVKMKRLPDTQGMKNEIIIQTMHRFPYDQCYRAPGGVLVEIGDAKRCYSWELEGAINERTAAVAYLFAPFTNRRSIPFEEVCRIAHERDVPVIVDGASMLPPRENLYRYLRQGADMVIYSGGKGVRGPQASGILCGRKDLIEAASANANPNQFFGRSMKVAKEEIVGLLTALELFVVEDEDAETRRYEEMSRRVVDSLTEVPGLELTLRHDDYDYLIPHAVMRFTKAWRGLSRDHVAESLEHGDPPVYLHQYGDLDELAVDPTNLTDDELEIVIHRLREELLP